MVSVIIPVYKARKTLPDALDSLVAQTFKRFFVIISQDGDGEDYSDIIEEYIRRGLHIHLIKSEENQGPGLARQAGIDFSEKQGYEYVMFCDADDMYMPRTVEVLYKEIQKTLSDLIISSFIAEESSGNAQFLRSDETPITWCHGKIYRLKYLTENNIRFIPELRLNEDSYFNLVAVNSTKKKKRINEFTYLWRNCPDSLTRHGEEDLTESFFHHSWQQYIYSQVKGIQKIIDLTGTIDTGVLCATILNLYYHIERALFFNIDYSEVIPLLCEFKEIQVIQDIIMSEDFWMMLSQTIDCCSFSNKVLFFYRENFLDWFNAYIVVEKKEGE